MITLQHLKQLVTIADVGSMNEAAKQLYISQPNLSATVKDAEASIGLPIFLRTNRGIRLTPEGEEFIGYARQVLYQYELLDNKFLKKDAKKKFSVSCQHYSFCVRAFVEMVQEVGMDAYDFAIHETTTREVIDNVKNLRSEIGILYLSDFNRDYLSKLMKSSQVQFDALFDCDTYVYLWRHHPLANRESIAMADLEPYPCLAFEQGDHSTFYLAEEMKSDYDYKKIIRGDDRATMLNLMVGLNGYTLCSGIICEDLNGDDYVAVPLAESEKMTIGYLHHKGVSISDIGQLYLDKLSGYAEHVLPIKPS